MIEEPLTNINKQRAVSEYVANNTWFILWSASDTNWNCLIKKQCLKTSNDFTETEEVSAGEKIALFGVLTSLILLVITGFIQAPKILDALQEVSVNSAKQMMLID